MNKTTSISELDRLEQVRPPPQPPTDSQQQTETIVPKTSISSGEDTQGLYRDIKFLFL